MRTVRSGEHHYTAFSQRTINHEKKWLHFDNAKKPEEYGEEKIKEKAERSFILIFADAFLQLLHNWWSNELTERQNPRSTSITNRWKVYKRISRN
jgi:hypothetical protein